jgi:predicted protein tyrosine phosphatase
MGGPATEKPKSLSYIQDARPNSLHMYIAELKRHLYVCSLPEYLELVKRDKDFWNVVSIHEPELPRAPFRGVKKIHYAAFHDIENADQLEICRPARAEDLAEIFRFVDSLPGAPIIVHCRAGLSRSTAVALSLIVRGFVTEGRTDYAARAAEILLSLRPQARPNVLVLRLGLSQFLPADVAEELTKEFVNHPQMMENRFIQY